MTNMSGPKKIKIQLNKDEKIKKDIKTEEEFKKKKRFIVWSANFVSTNILFLYKHIDE